MRWRVERKARELFWSYPWRVFMVPPGEYTSWVYLGECRSWQEAMELVEDLIKEEKERATRNRLRGCHLDGCLYCNV